MLEVAFKPMVADFVYLDYVNSLSDAVLFCYSQVIITAQSLNIHSFNFKALLFKQYSVVIQLYCPIE